ncbi:hypothetical protein FZEAL_10821 [Fusarium zealandicum]|uniref:SnoaL-like domain-containing protein n=1 Tax=Fusarium zealandicum TaxID=1053134 RepID=A0A8H4TVY3_9HYPO|nr:hypothetical protein FZEAL_10821 [Fusarium zealandicum]
MSPQVHHTARSILDSFYAAERVYMSAPPEERDFSGMAATLSEDVRLEQTSGLPYAGTFIGPQGMQDWAKQMADYFEDVDVQDPQIFEKEGSSRIVALSNLHLKVRKTGEELDFPFCQVVTVDLEAGVIARMQPFYWDVQELNRAIGYQK